MLTIPSNDWHIKQDAGTTDLLLIVYKRRPPRGDGIEVAERRLLYQRP